MKLQLNDTQATLDLEAKQVLLSLRTLDPNITPEKVKKAFIATFQTMAKDTPDFFKDEHGRFGCTTQEWLWFLTKAEVSQALSENTHVQ
jgi:hypothetical protein